MFAETADIDGDGEIDKDDFLRLMHVTTPTWSEQQCKNVFWQTTSDAGKEVLDATDLLALSREYELFNSALQLPQFTSEEDLLSVGELELVRVLAASRSVTGLAGAARLKLALQLSILKGPWFAIGLTDLSIG